MTNEQVQLHRGPNVHNVLKATPGPPMNAVHAACTERDQDTYRALLSSNVVLPALVVVFEVCSAKTPAHMQRPQLSWRASPTPTGCDQGTEGRRAGLSLASTIDANGNVVRVGVCEFQLAVLQNAQRKR